MKTKMTLVLSPIEVAAVLAALDGPGSTLREAGLLALKLARANIERQLKSPQEAATDDAPKVSH